jgi:hypothetical protein
LRYLGEPEVDFPSEQVGDRAATMSDNLENYLESNWAEWATALSAIEAAAGIQLKKNQCAYRTATREAKGTTPKMFMQILAKAEGK